MNLPIDPLLPAIVAALREGPRLVLRAPPGAGKTTRVPAALLDGRIAGDKQIVVLEPRRIAARAAASFVARERRSEVGDEVGYRVRYDSRGNDATRLWFVTEGILGRQLARDPFLEHIGVVILDEFHERHLQGDIALGVVRELQETIRPDLKLVVMSATLDTTRVADYLGDGEVLTAEGRVYPVRIEYDDERQDEPLAHRVCRAVQRTLTENDDGGDVLVFLPGAREIRRAAEVLVPLAVDIDFDVVTLHGEQPLAEQERALRKGLRRKVVLATNVAETSLTIEGVTAVVDSGLVRLNRFDARRGINALRTVGITRASADQRAGRAGRTAPGVCVRLWSRERHSERREAEIPEIRRLDLCATILELRAWGLARVSDFRWLDPPDPASVERAESLLRLLGAIDASTGDLTTIGRRMTDLGVEPRLARILIEAEGCRCAHGGALIAALASERDILLEARAFAQRSVASADGPSDLLVRAELFEEAMAHGFSSNACRDLGLETGAVRAVERARRHFLGRIRRNAIAIDGPSSRENERAASRRTLQDIDLLLRCILAGFPDRVARRRAEGSRRAVMVGATGVVLAEESVVRQAELFVATELDAGEKREFSEARVRSASAIDRGWLDEMFPLSVHSDRELVFDTSGERVVERKRTRFGDLVLEESTNTDVDADVAGDVLAAAAGRAPRRAARVGPEEEALLGRIAFLSRCLPELELPAAESLLADAVVVLCQGRKSFAEVRAQHLGAALLEQLSHRQRQALEREAPREFRLPSGRLANISYVADKAPTVAARIQEVFGLDASPRVAGNRVPLVFELLAPNQRPAQVTDDLASFWRSTYAEVRKQLRGRYPKHNWPEDPFSAKPTSRVKRK